MSRSILISGAGGQVGFELSTAPSEHRKVALTRQQLDITDRASVCDAISEHRPDILINAAAYTAVDRAEEDSEGAFEVNRDGIGNLALACREACIPLLHISTDYVFDGDQRLAYVETDPVAPIGVYGESKAAGEELLRSVHDEHIILRSSWVFSQTGSNFVKTMLRLGRERNQLGIVDDQQGCPTSARSIARVLLQISDLYLAQGNLEWGTYHYCDAPQTTWYKFARDIFRLAGGYDDLVLKPIGTADYPMPARRPMYSVLNCEKLERVFDIAQTSWREELDYVLSKLVPGPKA